MAVIRISLQGSIVAMDRGYVDYPSFACGKSRIMTRPTDLGQLTMQEVGSENKSVSQKPEALQC